MFSCLPAVGYLAQPALEATEARSLAPQGLLRNGGWVGRQCWHVWRHVMRRVGF